MYIFIEVEYEGGINITARWISLRLSVHCEGPTASLSLGGHRLPVSVGQCRSSGLLFFCSAPGFSRSVPTEQVYIQSFKGYHSHDDNNQARQPAMKHTSRLKRGSFNKRLVRKGPDFRFHVGLGRWTPCPKAAQKPPLRPAPCTLSRQLGLRGYGQQPMSIE